MELAEAAFFTDIPSVYCPHCAERFLRAEDLEVHRERHRPVPPRVTGSRNCPKGCMRWLVPGTAETQAHLALCDGSPPLNGLRCAMKTRWFCHEHGYGTNGPRGWGKHKADYHGGRDPVRLEKNPLKAMESDEAVDHAIELIRAEKGRLGLEIGRLDAAIKILERRKERDQS